MKVQWSSTYIMLVRASEDKQYVDDFVYEIAHEEKDKAKCSKLDNLTLAEDEWERADLFIQLLVHTNERQQAFSSETQPCLQDAIPALEGLHKAWTVRVERPKYVPFADALQAATEKIADYYDKTGDTDAYVISMYLTPNMKGMYFKKNWDASLQRKAETLMEKVFCERYTKLHSTSAPPEPGTTGQRQRYLGTNEEIYEGTSVIHWWGANVYHYPVWASLAQDYLSIMATSISSKRAFSQGSITISKRRNCLKNDIVEALQCLKCAIRHDLLLQASGPSSVTEETISKEEDSEELTEAGTVSDEEESGGAWDLILEDDDEE
ncbi:hypothetical protein EW026_g4310 [Hermanssonia centrifuga]|uniref:HAT C-terminal dimerisation domain-containing protein n=1 Tax=Hermanssonia centrifuga TaxID=98765 RepID=A0A4S4KHW5_9APHY|nr:hypothetical protein EW026_g4310 [Hermanssonia centrifuga]